MTEPVQTTGKLAAPLFKGPPQPRQWRRPVKSRWDDFFTLGRQHPAGWPQTGPLANDRGWMVVSKVTRGGRKATMRAITNDRNQIQNHLNRHFPLERWQLQVATVPDTWCDRELYMRFLGTLTPEQDAADRAERRATYERKIAHAREKKARDALAARLAARAEMDANRAQGAKEG
jgi:hypothetical protein